MSMGGATFTRGFNGSAAWAVGPDGKVQMDTSPEGVKAPDLGHIFQIVVIYIPTDILRHILTTAVNKLMENHMMS